MNILDSVQIRYKCVLADRENVEETAVRYIDVDVGIAAKVCEQQIVHNYTN